MSTSDFVKRLRIRPLGLATALALAACQIAEPRATTEEPQVSAVPLPLSQITFWAYQLQDISGPRAVDALAASHYDLLVLEPTRTDWSSDDKLFDTRTIVERLKSTAASDGSSRKLIIAYIDIGEAEDWRWYWRWSKIWPQDQPRPDDWPDYILTHDPDAFATSSRPPGA